MSSPYTLDDLLHLMARLRDPATGCAWDVQQTHESIAPYAIEEAYEVVDAIEQKDWQHLREELGDLLLQVIFHGQMAAEAQRFTFADVVHELTAKLVRRHPHVFPGGSLRGTGTVSEMAASQVKGQWEAMKQLEREQKGQQSVLADVPLALPALKRAQKLQKRAAKVGFDWDESAAVFAQLEAELEELRVEIATASDRQTEELGDVLFSVANLARHLGADAEEALRLANQKFVRRFTYIEHQFAAQGETLEPAKRNAMEAFWQQAKQHGL